MVGWGGRKWRTGERVCGGVMGCWRFLVKNVAGMIPAQARACIWSGSDAEHSQLNESASQDLELYLCSEQTVG